MLQVPPTDGGLVGFDSVVLPLSLPCSAALFSCLVRSSSPQAIRHGGSGYSLCVFEELEISYTLRSKS